MKFMGGRKSVKMAAVMLSALLSAALVMTACGPESGTADSAATVSGTDMVEAPAADSQSTQEASADVTQAPAADSESSAADAATSVSAQADTGNGQKQQKENQKVAKTAVQKKKKEAVAEKTAKKAGTGSSVQAAVPKDAKVAGATRKKAQTLQNTQSDTPQTQNQNENSTGSGSQTPGDAAQTPSQNAGTAGKAEQDGYHLVWEDEFNGNSLNTADWNYEYHEPGWVNQELQKYVDDSQNIYVKDGKLIIRAVKTVDQDGKVSYTSGRINTQNKHDFKYGRFEARIKVPSGKGFLPAFWMMPADENLYGQWPKCGEVDIMEVLGDKTDTAYGTLHFGEPHMQRQGSVQAKDTDYASGYHTFTCDWEPGSITWYMDGQKYYSTDNWFTKKSGGEEEPYPAPFNQPFYMILNLAVGGSWPGYPDEDAKFDDNAQLCVDYVRVYQKSSYDENVKKPEAASNFRDPDSTGNYCRNGNFSEEESLDDDLNWKFLLAGTGKADASIHDQCMHIQTQDAGNLDYSVQLVQADQPMQKGYTYRLSFDAWADDARTMITDVSAPDNGYIRYLDDTRVKLGTERQSYSYDFDMTQDSDPNGRIEFNLGNQKSTATVHITGVRLEKVKKTEHTDQPDVLQDGECIYNGDFANGMKHYEFFTDSGISGSVSHSIEENDGKKEFAAEIEDTGDADWKIQLKQSHVRLEKGKCYRVSFDADATTDRDIMYALQRDGSQDNDWTPYSGSNVISLTGESQHFTHAFRMERDTDPETILSISMGAVGGKRITDSHVVHIRNIEVKEVSDQEVPADPETPSDPEKPEQPADPEEIAAGTQLIQNGDFAQGSDNWTQYVQDPAAADITFADGRMNCDITAVGDADWHVQLKQGGLHLEKGASYQVSFKIKSSESRTVRYAFLNSKYDWYGGSDIALEAGQEKEVSDTITVGQDKESNPDMTFVLSMGKIDDSPASQIELSDVSVIKK